ncbi:MAG: CPBP family intramembrane metalloprotease [Blastocatellia bacterium]|nr:CPBP family intramembrane metalloprotease [Blastocatellia bacterium]MDQ3118893.1 CPBP family intramembrane metalloprotease [Verrucomicrobiota bacterium]
MQETKSRTWRKIGCFYAFTLLFTGFFSLFAIRVVGLDAGNLLYYTGLMWSPALAAFLTKWLFGESLRSLPWGLGPARYAWLGYFIPVAYIVPVYLFAWLTGLGGFADTATLRKVLEPLGWSSWPPAVALPLFILFTATLGFVGKTSRALGEEIGWRGFLVPELAKVVGFPGVALISGSMWAVFHYPILIFGDYNAGTPVWFGLGCFTVGVIAESFVLAWLTLRSRSLWPAAFMHGSHNLWMQSILTPLTRDTGPTPWVIDEFGIGLVVTTIVAGLICWRLYRQRPAA